MKALIVHGHFYQPPRENPWTGQVESEASAAPFHDWNERIHFECYRANAFVRAGDPGPDEQFVNNYAHISFNFGPTLLTWLEQHHAYTYARVCEADRESALQRNGHGNAIAQAYGHAILPLCNERDLRTQIRWGIADFRHRFGREPEAMWLPETAGNDKVLTALIDEGLRYVILAPHQAARVSIRTGDRPDSANEWHEVNQSNLNTSMAYRYVPAGRREKSIAVFFYDGPTSRAVAFEKRLSSSRELVDGFTQASRDVEMINIATDGETYGHHFKFGDLCLSHALISEAPSRGFKVTNYGEWLDDHPPRADIEINNGPRGEGSSWSCAHGVDRWIRNCGCHTGGEPGWNQSWRTPLRAALDFLRDENIPYFESTRNDLFTFPWVARDESISLILNKNASREEFLRAQANRRLFWEDQARALGYLELQRMLLLMYTSCGWFFNDISGIETIQILKYAARAIDLMEQLGLPSLHDKFLEILAEARSNRTEIGNGADIYRRIVEPLDPTMGVRGLAILST